LTTNTALSIDAPRMLGTSRWKRLAIVATGSLTALSLLVAVAIYMLGRGPAFFRQIDTLSDEDRTAESRQFVQQSSAVFNQIENEPAWSGTFRESHVNAWLAGDFARKHGDLLPRGVSDPRVSFANGCVALAFQLQRGPVTTIISARGRMWLPESNFVAFELEGVRAGVIPMPAGYVIQTISLAAKSAGLDLEWKQHDGNPVALFRMGRSDESTVVRVDQVEIKDGTLRVAGRSRGQGTFPGLGSREGASSDMSWNVQAPEAPHRK
jgi:hypothetical protein